MFKIIERRTGIVWECATDGQYICNSFLEWYNLTDYMVTMNGHEIRPTGK